PAVYPTGMSGQVTNGSEPMRESFDASTAGIPTLVIENSGGRIDMGRVYDLLFRTACTASANLQNYLPHRVTIVLTQPNLPDREILEEAAGAIFGPDSSVLSLFIHSAGTLEEMFSLFLERAPRVSGAVVTYPLLLDRRRDILHANPLANITDAGIEQACLA